MRKRVAVLPAALSRAAVALVAGSPVSCVGALCVALLAGCEDGPDQVFFPLQPQQAAPPSGPSQPSVFVAGETKGFGDGVAEDDVGRAKFCAETEETELAQEMVVQPIIPDVSAGGVPLWAASGGAVYADDLLGPRSEDKFCNPGVSAVDGFAWGPTNEVILLFNEETHLVESVVVTQQYLGAMQGTFADAGGAATPVVVQPRERLNVGGQLMDVYASRVQAQTEPRSWMNPANVTKLYRMVRETFFSAAPLPADFDCVASQVCDLIFTSANEDTPQTTAVVLQDSGVALTFTPEGYVNQIRLTPVRSAPFENGGGLGFGAADAAQMAFGFQSQFRGDCALDLDSATSWADFQARCIASGDERVLDRVIYDVATARDAVAVQFNGITLNFMRAPSLPLLQDGERPDAADVLYQFSFTRSMPAAVAEFRPQTLGNLYKARLEQRLQDSIVTPAGQPPPANHPLATFDLAVPFTADDPQQIGELIAPDNTSWLPGVLTQVADLYASLTPEEKAVVDERVLDPVYLLEPFVDSVLFAFSHGESDAAGAVKAFRTTDDKRWSLGYASFRRAGVPYRLLVQYALNFGAVTSVTVSRGDSIIDQVIDAGRGAADPAAPPYFEAQQMLGGTLLSLGSNAVSVTGVDRQLATVSVSINGLAAPVELQLSGTTTEDRSGYLRQIRGERYEFIPSDRVNLYGKETALALWIREDGTIGRVTNLQFKGSLELCPGLPISYGDDVKQRLLEWETSAPPQAYRDCDLVFNYSENGNVLAEVASIGNRVAFSLVDGRALDASVWE